MRSKLRRTGGYGDHKLDELARDTQKTFEAISDITYHKVSIVWQPPFFLAVPFFGGEPRLRSPDLVECPRARNTTDPTTLVTPGGCAWEFVSKSLVRVDDVSGLLVDSAYDLVFRVTG